jgi:hypothetical protein
MSFLKKLFGGGGQRDGDKASAPVAAVKSVEYKGFMIEARPYKEAGQFQTAGVVWKEVEGQRQEHSFIRADRFAAAEDAADHALFKGKQIVDQQGDAIFR